MMTAAHTNKVVYVMENYRCWNCKEKMAIAFGRDGDRTITPAEFVDPDAIIFAKEHGVKLRMQYSKAVKMTYLANICPHCDMIQGNFYIVAQFEHRSVKVLSMLPHKEMS